MIFEHVLSLFFPIFPRDEHGPEVRIARGSNRRVIGHGADIAYHTNIDRISSEYVPPSRTRGTESGALQGTYLVCSSVCHRPLQTFRIFLMQALLDKSRVDMKLIAITPLM
jgi:hypothetical protein